MTDTVTTKVMSPEEIAARQMGDAPLLRLATTADIFRERETRLRQLAAGHAMRDYLIFMADVCAAQHRALQADTGTPLPSQESLGDAAKAGVPPLSPTLHRRDASWRTDLQAILADVLPRAAEGPAQVIRALQSADADHLERQADRLLNGVMLGLDLGQAPLVGAALQVYWTRLVANTQHAYPDLAFGRIDDGKVCPCCGSHPVASVARIGGTEAGARYLHCVLCQTEWHMVRIQCAHCGSGKNIVYHEIEASADDAPRATAEPPKGAVRAEACEDCHHYLKIVSMEKDAFVDPVADDLASVTLDLLTAEAGFARHGVNFMLLFGAGDDDAPGGP